MRTPIDFGNGIIAYFRGVPGLTSGAYGFIEKGHNGFTAPEFEVTVTENGILDGGNVDGSRALPRAISCTVSHRGAWTIDEIQRAFTPGVLRYMTTERGTLPYYVRSLSFPDSLNLAQYRFSLSLISPLAYPEGPEVELTADDSALSWSTISHSTGTPELGNSYVYEEGGVQYAEFFQTFPVGSGVSQVRAAGLYFDVPQAASVRVRLARVDDSGADTLSITEVLHEEMFGVSVGDNQFIGLETPVSVSVTGQYAVLVRVPTKFGTRVLPLLKPYVDAAAGYSGGKGGSRGTVYYFRGFPSVPPAPYDTTVDYKFAAQLGTTAASSSVIYVNATTDVPAFPVITAELVGSASSLAVSDGTNTCTITGSLAAEDVVVIDSANNTVTVNGTNRMAWFDRDGAFPVIPPTGATLTFSEAVVASVKWKPRLMGLVGGDA